MDEQKDILIKKTESKKDQIILSSFKSSSFPTFFKKTEKIVTAIFLITNYFEPEDVLKMSLRKSATELFKSVTNLGQGHLYQRQLFDKKIYTQFLEIITYFEIAFYSNLISENNFNLIISEVYKNIDLFKNIFSSELDSENILKNNFFETKLDHLYKNNLNQSPVQNKKSVTKEQTDKGHYKNSLSFKGQSKDFMSFINNKTNQNLKINTNIGQASAPVKKDKNKDRRLLIIDEIKSKGQVSIKDLTDKFKDVSEKTIQRELLKMVEENVLLKEGERRWSRYSLNKNSI